MAGTALCPFFEVLYRKGMQDSQQKQAKSDVINPFRHEISRVVFFDPQTSVAEKISRVFRRGEIETRRSAQFGPAKVCRGLQSHHNVRFVLNRWLVSLENLHPYFVREWAMYGWKKQLFAGFLAFGALTATAAGPDEIQALEFMKHSFSQIDINRISYISQQMALDGPTSEKFWPRYQAYLHKQIALRDTQLATLTKFAGYLNRERLGAKASTSLLGESMAQEKQRLVNRQEFVRQLAGILNPQQQLRLYQLELLLDAQVRSSILSQVPLADAETQVK